MDDRRCPKDGALMKRKKVFVKGKGRVPGWRCPNCWHTIFGREGSGT